MLERLKQAQQNGDLQHFNERYDSARQAIDKMNELQARHWEQIDVSKLDQVKSKPLEPTTGPTPYEAERAQEDAWESES